MPEYIVILRGINVGGKRKILMADLKNLFEKLDFKNVRSYIQSGNVIFNSTKNISIQAIEAAVEKEILQRFGLQVPVIAITSKQLKEAIENNQFYHLPDTDIDRLHLTFLKQEPSLETLQKIKSIHDENDNFQIVDRTVFIYCSGKYSDSKFSNKFFETKLKVSATTRNWKTILKIKDLLSE